MHGFCYICGRTTALSSAARQQVHCSVVGCRGLSSKDDASSNETKIQTKSNEVPKPIYLQPVKTRAQEGRRRAWQNEGETHEAAPA